MTNTTKKNTNLNLTAKERYERKTKLGKIGPLLRYRMSCLRNHCTDSSIGRKELSTRREVLANLINTKSSNIKQMYLYGYGPQEHWDTLMDAIHDLKQEDIVDIYINYPYIKEKIDSLPKELKSIHRNLAKLNKHELQLVDRLICAATKMNDAVEDE